MSYSLISRDIMAAMVEIHALGHPHDGMVLISGNDKSVPAHLVAIARCGLPAIHLPGGTQLNAPDYMTSNRLWAMGAAVERGEIPCEDLEHAQRGACPTCGACQFMGSASMTGPCVGHVTPEALDGGPIALIEEDDLIEINIPERRLAVVGVKGQRLPEDQVEAELAERRRNWTPQLPRHSKGILSLYARVARGCSDGASIT
jgi:dihydroxyacid dehydratase/phosphogluconate dehydratase